MYVLACVHLGVCVCVFYRCFVWVVYQAAITLPLVTRRGDFVSHGAAKGIKGFWHSSIQSDSDVNMRQ